MRNDHIPNSTVPKTACIDIGQLLSSIPASPSLHSELFKVDDNLIAGIYNVVEKILRNPPLYAWFDSNYRTAERTFTIQVVDDIFTIQVVDDIAYVDVIADCTVAVNRYKIKDFITQLPTGKWEPDLEAIKNIKIYYDVFS